MSKYIGQLGCVLLVVLEFVVFATGFVLVPAAKILGYLDWSWVTVVSCVLLTPSVGFFILVSAVEVCDRRRERYRNARSTSE